MGRNSARDEVEERLREIASRRKHANTALLGLGSKVYAAFLEMEKATYADGALARKVKELIAVGISVVRVKTHTSK